jgi:hypothetical protein
MALFVVGCTSCAHQEVPPVLARTQVKKVINKYMGFRLRRFYFDNNGLLDSRHAMRTRGSQWLADRAPFGFNSLGTSEAPGEARRGYWHAQTKVTSLPYAAEINPQWHNAYYSCCLDFEDGMGT